MSAAAWQALLVATGVVALAEIGDKTQLLAFMLAARFVDKKGAHIAIISGIFAATILNHAFAGFVGGALAAWLGPTLLRWVVGLGFIAMAVWMLIPDKLDDAALKPARFGIFGTTFIAFFLAEMGDKTQVATVALAAEYASTVAVVIGTTLGMMIANVPAVLVGAKLAHRMPVKLVHGIAALIFLVLGVTVLLT